MVIINDNENMIPVKHNTLTKVGPLSESMKDSIRAFIISCSLRDSRGDKDKHKTMMVNITHLNALQIQLTPLIEDYLKELKKTHKKVLDLKKSDLTRDEKISKTIQAMKDGWEIIHGGWLKKDKWTGEFDFLIINKELKSKFGDYSYEVIDTKYSNKVKK